MMRLVSQPFDAPNSASNTRNIKSEFMKGASARFSRREGRVEGPSCGSAGGAEGANLTLQMRNRTTKTLLNALNASSLFLLQIWNLGYEQMMRPNQSATLYTMKWIDANICGLASGLTD